MTEIEKHLIRAGVKNLQEFGYPGCTEENILTDDIYSKFFASMLDSNLGHSAQVDVAIGSLKTKLAELAKPKSKAKRKKK